MNSLQQLFRMPIFRLLTSTFFLLALFAVLAVSFAKTMAQSEQQGFCSNSALFCANPLFLNAPGKVTIRITLPAGKSISDYSTAGLAHWRCNSLQSILDNVYGAEKVPTNGSFFIPLEIDQSSRISLTSASESATIDIMVNSASKKPQARKSLKECMEAPTTLVAQSNITSKSVGESQKKVQSSTLKTDYTYVLQQPCETGTKTPRCTCDKRDRYKDCGNSFTAQPGEAACYDQYWQGKPQFSCKYVKNLGIDSFTVSPILLSSNSEEYVTLSWSAPTASSCKIKQYFLQNNRQVTYSNIRFVKNDGTAVNPKEVPNKESEGIKSYPLTTTYYTLTCVKERSTVSTRPIRVAVSGKRNIVFDQNPEIIDENGKTYLSWKARADYCTASKKARGTNTTTTMGHGLQGKMEVTLERTYDFTVHCYSAQNAKPLQEKTVVGYARPSISSFTANNKSIESIIDSSMEWVTLRWSATNSSSCSLRRETRDENGSWIAQGVVMARNKSRSDINTLPASGSLDVYPTVSTKYVLICANKEVQDITTQSRVEVDISKSQGCATPKGKCAESNKEGKRNGAIDISSSLNYQPMQTLSWEAKNDTRCIFDRLDDAVTDEKGNPIQEIHILKGNIKVRVKRSVNDAVLKCGSVKREFSLKAPPEITVFQLKKGDGKNIGDADDKNKKSIKITDTEGIFAYWKSKNIFGCEGSEYAYNQSTKSFSSTPRTTGNAFSGSLGGGDTIQKYQSHSYFTEGLGIPIRLSSPGAKYEIACYQSLTSPEYNTLRGVTLDPGMELIQEGIKYKLISKKSIEVIVAAR